MNRRKIDRALYGPSIFEVTLGAILSILLGLALAFIFLVLKPVEVVRELPKESERIQGAVYFVEGNRDQVRAKQWRRKRQMFVDGAAGDVALTEEELNAWFADGSPAADKKAAPRPAASPKGGAPAPAAEPEVPSELLTFDSVDFRIRESTLQVGIPAQLNLVVMSFPVVLQARGGFDKEGEVWMYKPSQLYLGSMPLHRIPGFSEMLVQRVMNSNLVPQEAMAAWRRVSQASLEGRQLKLTIAPVAAENPEIPPTSS